MTAYVNAELTNELLYHPDEQEAWKVVAEQLMPLLDRNAPDIPEMLFETQGREYAWGVLAKNFIIKALKQYPRQDERTLIPEGVDAHEFLMEFWELNGSLTSDDESEPKAPISSGTHTVMPVFGWFRRLLGKK